MGKRGFSAYSGTDTSLVTTAETVIATLTGVSTNQPGQTVALRGQATITLGTGTTAIALRVRRDSVSGALVGEPTPDQIETAAGSTETHDIYVEDQNAGEFAGRTYVLTAQQTGASGNGNALQASLAADVTP